MANEIANVVKAMITFGLYLDAEDVPQLVTLNQVGVKSARLLKDDEGEPTGVVIQLMEPCAFYVLPELFPVITAPIPSAQVIATGYGVADGSAGELPAGGIVPSDAPLSPTSGLTEADRGAAFVQWSVEGALVPPPIGSGGNFWQVTVLEYPSGDGSKHGVVINV
jgi:hypothetical protein